MRPEPTVNQSASAVPEPLRGIDGVALALLLAAGAVVRFAYLARKPFWFDECFSAEVAGMNWGNFLHLLWWREANMSLYYVLLRGWLHFGGSEFFIRSLSVVIAVATLPTIYWLGRLLYDRRVALVATALLAFNAYHVRYSQEARSYALLVLLATLSSAFLVAYLRRQQRAYRLGYVVVSILAVYSHFYALLLIAAQWLAVRGLGPPEAAEESQIGIRAELRRAWTTIAVAVLPIVIFVGKTGAGPIRWIQRPGWRDLLQFWTYFTGFEPILYAVAGLVAAVSLGRRLWKRPQSWDVWRYQFLCLWLLFPIALTALLSFARPVFLGRYMIFCLPALVILVAAGVLSVRPRWLAALVAAAFILLGARTVPFVYDHDFDTERDASGTAVNLILDHAQPGDAIMFYIPATRAAYEFFRSERFREHSAAAFTEPEILFPHNTVTLDSRDFTGKPTADFLRTVPPTHPRVWLMLMNSGGPENPDPTTQLQLNSLTESFGVMQRWQFARVEIRLYTKSHPEN